MLHQELLPAVALCPGKASWDTGAPALPCLPPGSHLRQERFSLLWLSRAGGWVLHSQPPFSPPGHNPSRELHRLRVAP